MALNEQIRQARLRKGMTQSEMAAWLSCSQSAISRYEGGAVSALSVASVRKMAGHLGVDVAKAGVEDSGERGAAVAEGAPLQFCPSVWCPSGVPFYVHGRLCLMPLRLTGEAAHARHCTFCGEPLRDRCPACGANVADGACCGQCGQPLVPVNSGEQAEVLEARRRAAEVARLGRDLMDTLRPADGGSRG